MKGYRFITDDDTVDFCQRVTEALSNGWKLHGEPKMTYDEVNDMMACLSDFDSNSLYAIVNAMTSEKARALKYVYEQRTAEMAGLSSTGAM